MDIDRKLALTLFEYKQNTLFWKTGWQQGEQVGYIAQDGYRRFSIKLGTKREYFYVHRTIWIMIFGEIRDGLFIDHKNGIRDDNWLGNLRLVTRRQNQYNKFSQKESTSRYKGVWWDEVKGYWKASFRFEDKRVYLGQFNTELEAAAAYDSHARQVHGEYAKLNLV